MTTQNYFKISMLLITFGLLTSCSNSNDWNRSGLNGKIKTYLERTYKVEKKFGKWEIGDLKIIDYSEKSFVVTGNTKPIKDTLKDLGGKFNFRLSCGAGWVFSKTKIEEVKSKLNSTPSASL